MLGSLYSNLACEEMAMYQCRNTTNFTPIFTAVDCQTKCYFVCLYFWTQHETLTKRIGNTVQNKNYLK